MKKFILSALVAIVTLVASAQEAKQFVNEVTGFTCIMPASGVVIKNDYEAIVLATQDQEFCITAIPFQPSKASEADIAGAINTLAQGVEVDLKKAKDIDIKTTNLEGALFSQTKANKNRGCVGVLNVKDGDLAFYVSIACSAKHSAIMEPLFKSLNFYAAAIGKKPTVKAQTKTPAKAATTQPKAKKPAAKKPAAKRARK